MAPETKSKISRILLDWFIKPMAPAVVLALFVFANRTSIGYSVNAAEINSVQSKQQYIQDELIQIREDLKLKENADNNSKQHTEIKEDLDKKASKEDIEALKATLSTVDNRTYQIWQILSKK